MSTCKIFNNIVMANCYLHRVLNANDEVDFEIAIPTPDSVKIADENIINNSDIYYYMSDKLLIPFRDMVKSTLLKRICEFDEDPSALLRVGIMPPKRAKISDYKVKLLFDDVATMYRPGCNNDIYERGRTLCNNYLWFGVKTFPEWQKTRWGCGMPETKYISHPTATTTSITFETDNLPLHWYEQLCRMNIPYNVEWANQDDDITGSIYSNGKTMTKKIQQMTADDEP